jgi:plasmid stability protein
MPAVTVRNLSGETHRALKLRAARNGRSTEAEIRRILEDAVSANTAVGLGSQLAALGRRFGGIELNITRD